MRDVEDDLAFFGIDHIEIDTIVEDNDFEVFPENWDAVQVFLACQTQWIVGGMGSIIGLNYQSVNMAMDLHDSYSVDTFDKVRVLESEALRLIKNGNKSRSKS